MLDSGKITPSRWQDNIGVLGEVSPYSVDVRVPMANGDVVFHVVPRDIKTVEVTSDGRPMTSTLLPPLFEMISDWSLCRR